LRTDPAFKLACGRLPDSGGDLCSQPRISRWENAPTLREIVALTGALVDAYCASYAAPPDAVTLDIGDTVDVVHGHQQMSLFNAHEDERCFKPIHVYDIATGRPVVVILRPGQNAFWRRGTRPFAPHRAPHSHTLAGHTPDHPRRQPLRAPRSDGMVREPPHRLSLRARRQQNAPAARGR
jgi:hypothetical protein